MITELLLKNRKKGMTLMEVVVASAILSVIVAGFLSVFLMSTTFCKSTNYVYIATNLAKSRTERLKGVDYHSLAQAEELDTRLNKDGVSDINGDFYRTTAINTGYGTDLTEVTVSVNFLVCGVRRPQPIVVKTVFANPE